MTSRRSRLKAVANLPVRRKAQVLTETSNESSPSDYISVDKTTSNKDNGSIVEVCQNSETEKVNYPSGNKEEILQCTNNGPNVQNGLSEKLISNLEPLESNNNETNKDTGAVKSFPTFKSRKHFKPNLVSLPKKTQKSEEAVSDIEKQNSDSVHTNATNSVTFEEGSKSFTVLDSKTTIDNTEPTYTISTLTPCDSNSVNDVYANQVSQEFEEVQLYTELEEPIDLFVSLPKVVNNEICESNDNLIEPEPEEEPIFTTLVNCSSSREVEKLDTDYERTNAFSLVDGSNNAFVKPASKNAPKNGRIHIGETEDASVTSRHDKSILGNINTPVSQNTTLDSDGFNLSLRRSVSSSRRKRSRCNDFTKKLADARREFQKKYEKSKPDRSSLKMIDLIFYNPTTNPMESKAKSDKRESISGQEIIQELLAEESVDEPETMDCSSDLTSENGEAENTNKMPVPQVKIGQNGEIILDEKSLVIETTEAKKGREDLQNSVPIFEDKGSRVSYYRGKTKKTKEWTDFETKRFYKALNTIGPDFSLMQKYFPNRSRLQLKNKFKREERLSRYLVDKALNNPSEFDMTLLEKELAVEKKAEEERIEMRLCKGINEKQTIRRPRVKSSMLSREMVESDGESENNHSQSDAIITKRMRLSEKSKKKKEMNLVFQKVFLNKANQQINELSEIGESPDSLRPPEHGVT